LPKTSPAPFPYVRIATGLPPVFSSDPTRLQKFQILDPALKTNYDPIKSRGGPALDPEKVAALRSAVLFK